jgi:hypothetical protein
MTTATATASCPYCRAPIEGAGEEPDEIVVCEECATPHHADCYAENGGCTVFGCSKAPVDEPKISISTSDLSRPVQPPAIVSSAPTPPPPRSRSTTAIPPPPSTRIGQVETLHVREDMTRYLTPPRTLTFGGYNDDSAATAVPAYIRSRSRLNFILYGVFLGSFGAHNFYAGYAKRATGQLLLTLFILFAGGAFWGGLVSWIWAIVEVCTVKQDDDGVAFV